MENDKGSAVDQFLGQVNGNESYAKPEENPFANLEVEQQEIVSEEKEVEKPIPFHEDPKLKRYIEKEIAKATANLTPKEQEKFEKEAQDTDLVSAFTAIIGNDTPEKINALKILGQTVDNLKQEATFAKDQLEAERRADIEAEQELTQGFENVEETFNVDFSANPKLKNEFADFIQRVAPKDSEGNIKDYPDFQETFKLFQELKAKPANRSKELASRSMTRGGEASQAPMPTDTSWKGVEKFFSTLKG